MSREERRQYQRMMRNMDRGPALPAAARSRAERRAARRAQRRQDAPPGSFTRGFVIRSVLVAAFVGLIGFSLQWPEMPFAAVVGVVVAAIVLGLLFGFRLLQRRAARSTS